MARDTLTGSRIRERRLMLGLRQADLARKVDISASYLNLIEHNRRRIGGKLLLDLAQELGVEPSMLTEGAEAALIAGLREAAADSGPAVAELDRVEELADRFPGWAEVMASQHRRISSLARLVETLSDRLTHDPHLAASLHEVLSTAAAIRSTASILAETGELEQEWRDRFHRNLNEDSARLAESSKALVAYLDDSDPGADRSGVPQEEAEAFLASHDHHFLALEDGSASPEQIVRAAGAALGTEPARRIVRDFLDLYAADARALPLRPLTEALAGTGPDPVALARRFGCELPVAFRRLALLPDKVLGLPAGLVVCDASGSILYRKAVPGFALPRHGESCPLWPLFAALSRPLVPIRRRVRQLGRNATQFDCLAVAWPLEPPGFDSDPVYHSAMLILPAGSTGTQGEAQPVGSSCRICPRDDCRARREPSILGEGF